MPKGTIYSSSKSAPLSIPLPDGFVNMSVQNAELPDADKKSYCKKISIPKYLLEHWKFKYGKDYSGAVVITITPDRITIEHFPYEKYQILKKARDTYQEVERQANTELQSQVAKVIPIEYLDMEEISPPTSKASL